MGKFSSVQIFLERVKAVLALFWDFLKRIYVIVWGWAKVRLPFVKALVRRHTNNPSTLFVDIAIAVLVLYTAFGLLGYILIYPKKSETSFTETLAILYPLPAAKVNNSFIWSHKFLERLRFLNTFNHQVPKDTALKPPTDAELRTRVLEGLIEDRVIVLEAKQRGLRVTEEELTKALEKQGKAEDVAKKIDELYGMNLADFKEIIAEQLLKEKVKNAVLTKVRVRHILISTQPVANEAKKQLDTGRDFAEVAKEFSQDAKSKDSGGDLGYWRKGELSAQISPGFEEAAFAQQVNQISGLIQSPFGFHILQVTERSGDNLQTYEEWYKQQLSKYRLKRYVKT
ncbi:MAG: peptidylprolyl isomerase [Candidatus Berkelbacteria bacterium]|nr:MAG: peptidylprolyl isomerase [Candidatus Berkelbacteria bacterium]QQG51986.1 MAG: peptidylprolyl isomerase [Candidatus Berkelbacteria bacterium]